MDHTDSSSNNDEFSEADTNSRIENIQECNEEDLETQSDGGKDDNDCWKEEDVEESSSDEEPDFNVVESPGTANLGPTKAYKLQACLQGGYENLG
ncbi:hypothetical protein L2E82_47677 [Cichorium intybus]|uniref:Uncharacterized protein n=1 Tax=Cichorium intybus TaxID=13427 RepID=A0ACB8YX83_CICIN|nr:hypothetical protein L2E82_47677 [Cichorium intybus]